MPRQPLNMPALLADITDEALALSGEQNHQIEVSADPDPAAPALRVHVLKRRGPPCEAPVLLPSSPPLLARLLQARRRAKALAPFPAESGRGLDRAAAWA